ncbi:MAG: response regulator [Gemmatimonadaceae bacterium]|nr:response regulator [Gemmatimonadaceae bacterium]NUS49280.1 response regulator [Gemmatimonadaceae bacterium]
MRLLAADDEADVRLLLELALGMHPDIVLTVVSSGRDAVDRAVDGQYDLIVLDGMMPDLDGAATCRLLKSDPRTTDIPVVFLTALTSESARAELRAAGAAGFVTKPFDPFTIAAELAAFSRPSP